LAKKVVYLNKREKGEYFMANVKPTFAKLKLQKNTTVKTVIVNDFEIEVKQYLPIEEKLNLITNVINYAADVNGFMNPLKVELFGTLEIIYAYSNISFTEKQREDSVNLYDTLVGSGVADKIIAEIPRVEYEGVLETINECIEHIYAYKNSAAGIIESVVQDYGNVSFNATEIQKQLADPNNMALLKDVLTKLG
jgi:isopropylmalate/homocitrate/citramalate synthase